MEAINFFFANFGMAMFIAALIIVLVHISISMIRRRPASNYEILFRWMILLPLGVTGVYTFFMHAFFPEFTATTIGWANSPFQLEVAIADLAFGILAILSFSSNASYGFRLATVIGFTCWLWGDAIVHIYQMIVHQNFAPGNAGSWFWMDVLMPLIVIICIVKMKPKQVVRII